MRAALRRRGLRPLLAAEILSTTGTAMTAVALPWLVLTTTHSPAKAGLVAAVEWVPMALLGIPSGAVATKLGPRRTMIACDLARVPLVASVPLLHWAGALTLGPLLVLAFLIGAFFPAHFSSQRTILPALLGEAAADVTRGNAVLQAANRLPLVLGPAFAGVLVAAFGPAGVLLIDAASYAVSALLLALLVPEPRRAEIAEDDTESEGLWAGVRVLAHRGTLRSLTAVYAAFELAMQMLFLSLPILAFLEYDEDVGVAALLLAAWGFGALAGTPLAMKLAQRDAVATVRVALLAQALPLWLLVAELPALVLAPALFASGLANPVANAPALTLVTLGVPEALRTKAMLAFTTASTAAGGAGLFLTGPAAEAFGVHQVILAAAALSTASAVGFALTSE